MADNEQHDETVAQEPPAVTLEEGRNLDYKDAYVRIAADYDNLKKETVRLRAEYARYAAGEMVTALLPVLDSMKKALAQAPADDGCVKWVEGIRLIRDQFEKAFAAAGVIAIEESGAPFDPSIHDALMRQKREGAASDTVIEIVEPGYRMHDRILRPAKVIVAE